MKCSEPEEEGLSEKRCDRLILSTYCTSFVLAQLAGNLKVVSKATNIKLFCALRKAAQVCDAKFNAAGCSKAVKLQRSSTLLQHVQAYHLIACLIGRNTMIITSLTLLSSSQYPISFIASSISKHAESRSIWTTKRLLSTARLQ